MDLKRTFLATTGAGLARATGTITGGWSVDLVLAAQDVRCLAADPRRTGVAYAGTQNYGVLRTADGGCTWQPAGKVFVSRDNGEVWTELGGFRRVLARWWFSPADGNPFTPLYRASRSRRPTRS
jgi:hypothetical protein